MSRESAETVRRWFSCLADGDAGVGLCGAEVRIDNVAEFPITGPYHGHVGRFRHTGIELDAVWASIVSVRRGEIVRAVGYASRQRALRAVGLPE
jgi:ketosteroid isomerase-like protein